MCTPTYNYFLDLQTNFALCFDKQFKQMRQPMPGRTTKFEVNLTEQQKKLINLVEIC